MPAIKEGAPNRNVQSGNYATRSKSSVGDFQQKAVVKTKTPMKIKRAPAADPKKRAAVDLEDALKAKQPKKVKA
jgi:hypothetical protein